MLKLNIRLGYSILKLFSIQIQHLLKLNKINESKYTVTTLIQIQHLLKLNSPIVIVTCGVSCIQIQHLLKLNKERKLYKGVTKLFKYNTC